MTAMFCEVIINLFTSCKTRISIGKEYVIAAMIFDILFNAFAAAANQMLLQLDMILQAEHMGLLNHAALTAAKDPI